MCWLAESRAIRLLRCGSLGGAAGVVVNASEARAHATHAPHRSLLVLAENTRVGR